MCLKSNQFPIANPHSSIPEFRAKKHTLQAEIRRQEEEAKKLRLQGQNPDAPGQDGDFMSEAKDWAGELISGQTGTGRILVRDHLQAWKIFLTIVKEFPW